MPDPIPFAAESVEGHWDVRRVALAFLNEFPIVAKAGDEPDVVFYPAVRDVTGFDQVNDREEHQRLVRSRTTRRRAGDVEVGEAAEPGIAGGLQVFSFRISGEEKRALAGGTSEEAAAGRAILWRAILQ